MAGSVSPEIVAMLFSPLLSPVLPPEKPEVKGHLSLALPLIRVLHSCMLSNPFV